MSFPILHRGSRHHLANTAPKGWDPTETTLGGSVWSGSSMTPRTAARLAWGIALLSYAVVAACLVLLWLDRATIGSVGAGPIGNVVPAATLGVLGALIASRRCNSRHTCRRWRIPSASGRWRAYRAAPLSW